MAARLFNGDNEAFIEAIKTHEFFIDILPCYDIHFNMDQHKNVIIKIGVASIDKIINSLYPQTFRCTPVLYPQIFRL